MSHAVRTIRRLAAPLLLAAALGGCSKDDVILLPARSTLFVVPDRAIVMRQQQINLTATLDGIPARTSVRWQSQDTSVFRLDTTTVNAHHVVGVGGRCVGTTTVTVTGGSATFTLPVLVLSDMLPGATRCLGAGGGA